MPVSTAACSAMLVSPAGFCPAPLADCRDGLLRYWYRLRLRCLRVFVGLNLGEHSEVVSDTLLDGLDIEEIKLPRQGTASRFIAPQQIWKSHQASSPADRDEESARIEKESAPAPQQRRAEWLQRELPCHIHRFRPE